MSVWPRFRNLLKLSSPPTLKKQRSPNAEEATQPEQYWRNCMVRAHRLLAERDGAPVGVASVQMIEGATQSADFRDLWVTPEARNTGVASRLVQAAADQATRDGCTKLYYWVSTENGRAIGFAINAGFRVTSQRRTTRTSNRKFGDQEIELVLSLVSDPAAVATSTPFRLTPRPGPTDQAPRMRHPGCQTQIPPGIWRSRCAACQSGERVPSPPPQLPSASTGRWPVEAAHNPQGILT
jgi:GNAT superfamily N-acetyltransferase